MHKSLIGWFLAVLVLATAVAADGADSTSVGWKKSLVLDATTTQVAYSDSWVGGEAGSLSWVSNLNGSAEKQLNPTLNLRSLLRLSFGQTLTQDDSTKQWSKPKKSTDLIDWDNLGRLTLGSYVDPYIAFRLESQFATKLSEQKTIYLSPIRLTESFGIARKFYSHPKTDIVISRFGFAFRQTFAKVLVDSVNTKSANSNDGGFELVTDAALTLSDRLLYSGKLTLYKAVFFSERDKVKGTLEQDYWKAIDVNWENSVTAQLSKIITVKFYTQVLYDKQISLRGRLKETLGIGFLFKLA